MSNNSNPPAADPNRDNLFRSYLRLFRDFRRNDLDKFFDEHRRLFDEARQTGDYIPATRHYYKLMASVIATYYANDTFLAGTLRHIIRGGQLGILTGSAMLTFERPLSQ